MDCEALLPLIDAHADGDRQPEVEAHVAGCPACAARLNAAVRFAERLQSGLAVPAEGDLRLAELRGRIAARLQPRRAAWWRSLAAAAALLVVAAPVAWLALQGRPAQATARVQRYTPMPQVVDVDVDILQSEQSLRRGQELELPGLQYARVTAPDGGVWLIQPGSRIAMNGSLVVRAGGCALERARRGTAGIRIGGWTLQATGGFRAVLGDEGLRLEVAAGTVTARRGADLRVCERGTHELGTYRGDPAAESRAALTVGFAHWQAERFADAAGAFERAWRTGPDPEPRATALFYYAASLGRDEQTAPAHAALVEFVERYATDRRRTYAEFFVGVYAQRLAKTAAARAAFQNVARSGDQQLAALARAHLQAIDGPPEPARGSALAVWRRFTTAWKARDYDAAEQAIAELERDHAAFRLVRDGTTTYYRWAIPSRRGQRDVALAGIDRFIQEFPAHQSVAFSRYQKAMYLSRMGRAAEALAALDALEHSHPTSPLLPHAARLRATLQPPD